MLPSRLRVVAATCGGLLAIAALPAFASASDEILVTVPVSGIYRGAEGSQVQVASAAVPAELVGQRCEIFGSTVNQRSVHPGNDLLIVNGDESFTIPDFEDEGDIVHDAGDVETLSETIQLFVIFGPDGASSGGFRVTVRNCVDDSTTTTVAPTTTTEAPPSTTEPPTTEPPTTVTTVTETTAVETTAVESTAVSTSEVAAEEPPVSSTTEPEPAGPTAPSTTTPPTTTPSTTAAPTTSEPAPLGPVAAGDELPVTGSSSGSIAALGAVLLRGGLVLSALGRRSSALG